jgi:hypothetical protein
VCGGSDCALLTERRPDDLYLQHALISGQGAEASAAYESWAKESFEIATKIAYRNGGRIGIPKGGAMDCAMVAAAPVLPMGYVASANRIAYRRMILAEYRLADLLIWVVGN